MTREIYSRRLVKFFDFIGLTEVTMKERSKAVAKRAKRSHNGRLQLFRYLYKPQKERIENREISLAPLEV